MNGEARTGPTGPSRRVWAILFALGLVSMTGFVALGSWQLARRSWKFDLIARIEARLAAAPAPAPGPALWSRIDAPGFEYRRLRVTGRYRHDRETPVRAVTALGSGRWVMTPLVTDHGWSVLVNRGFVPDGGRAPATYQPGSVTITGLLRLSEPGGGWPRADDPAADRWYARDVPAIARRRGLTGVAPYFIDADRSASAGAWPRAGLTEVRFHNHHLAYALTWFTLAAFVAAALALVARIDREWWATQA